MIVACALALGLLLRHPAAKAAATPAVPTPSAAREAEPWAGWFAKNTMVTDKKTYVHVFWNAQDARAQLSGPGKRDIVIRAAAELVRTAWPKKATADIVKVDIVFVRERDNYGLPKWDTLERVAHVELLRSKLESAGAGADAAQLAALCEQIEVY